MHAGGEAIARGIAEHPCEPAVQGRFNYRSAVLRPGVIGRGADDRNALRVARSAPRCPGDVRLDRQRLFVDDRHRRAGTLEVAAHDFVHAFGHQQIADAIGEIDGVVDDPRDLRPLAIGRRRRRLWQAGQARRQPRAYGTWVDLPGGEQRDAVHHVARADRFLRLVGGCSARRPPRIGEPQRPDELAEQRIAQATLYSIAVERGERLVARQALQDVFGAACALRIERDVEGALLVIGHEAATQDRRAGRLPERRRQQVAFAVGTGIGFQVLDPGEAADVHAGRFRGAELFELPAGTSRIPGIEPVREGIVVDGLA